MKRFAIHTALAAAAISLVLLLGGCSSLFNHGSSTWRGSDYAVNPPEFRAQVENQRNLAMAQMDAIGYKPRHKIKTFDILPGTVKRPKGWAVPASASPTGYAGGMTLSTRIWVVMDPHRRTIKDHDIRHEWKHAILMANFFSGTLDAQHAEIDRSEK